MSETCMFPLCTRIAQSNGLCIGHRIYKDEFPAAIIKEELKAKEQPKPINKVSEKMKGIKAELKKLYPIFLKKHPVCQMNTPVCTKKATCIHHTKGRGKNEILNEGTWMASCVSCNQWETENPEKAMEMGIRVSRLNKSTK